MRALVFRGLAFALAVVSLLLGAAGTARADEVAIVPAAAPSPTHPKGTALVIGAAAVERDIASGKELRTSGPLFANGASDVTSIVAEGETFVAASAGVNGDAANEVALWVLGPDLRPRERLALGAGSSPTLAAEGEWLAVGFYEWRTPVQKFKDWAPQYVYRVVLLDRASRKVIAQKVYGEPANLCPRTSTEDHVLVMANGRLFVSLPMPRHAHLVAAALPSLATVAEKDLAHDVLFGSMRLAWYQGRLVAIGPTWLELSPALAVLAERPWAGTSLSNRVAIDGARVLVDGMLPVGVRAAYRPRMLQTVDHVAWAWGTPLAVGRRGDETTPTELVRVPLR